MFAAKPILVVALAPVEYRQALRSMVGAWRLRTLRGTDRWKMKQKPEEGYDVFNAIASRGASENITHER